VVKGVADCRSASGGVGFDARTVSLAGWHAIVSSDRRWALGSSLDVAEQAHCTGHFLFCGGHIGGFACLYQENPEDTGGRPCYSSRTYEGDFAMTKRKTKNPRIGSSLDDFMKEEGLFEEASTQAIKEVIAWQLAEEMKEKGITKVRMAEMMKTSRNQLDRVLNPTDGNVTLETLQRAAQVLGRKVHLELV
jgi:antitoxin HicB